MFKSALINKEYSYENMNILELKKKIMEQEQLSEVDILCMYNEVGLQQFPLYPNAYSLSEDEIIKFNSILNEVFEESKIKFEELYEKEEARAFHLLFSLYDDFCKENNCEDILIERFLTLELVNPMFKHKSNDKRCVDLYEIIKEKYLKLQKEIENYVRYKNGCGNNHINYIDYDKNGASFSDNLYLDYFLEKVNEKIKNIFSNKFFVSSDTSDNVELPREIDIKKHKNNEYLFKNNVQSIYIFKGKLEHVLEKKNSRLSSQFKVELSGMFNTINLYYKLSKEEYDKVIIEGFWNSIEKIEGKIDNEQYNQEIESMPITINKVSNTGKVQLIDGFKRVLFVRNEDSLNQTVAIKVFNDLNDEDFFKLLYAANLWKKSRLRFHDRGFIFSLLQRFDICYSDFSMEKNYTLIRLLEIYDNIGLKISMGEDTISQKMNATYRSADYKTSHAFLVRDLVQLKKLSSFVEENQPYQTLVCEFFFLHFLQFLGYVRRLPVAQKDIDILDLIKKVLYSEDMKKLYKKKTFSSGTYVCNSFRDNGIDESIVSEIKNACFIETN